MVSQTRIAFSITILTASLVGLVVCLAPVFRPAAVPELHARDVVGVKVDDPSGHRGEAPAPGANPGELARPRLGADDGELPEGVTAFDTVHAGVTRLDPDLLRALQRAAADAPTVVYVTSGWRSVTYQERLLEAATAKYGSREAAARWVATPETSAHVSGDAVDVGRADTVAWLARNGASYGLCQIYQNEPWHFELVPSAVRTDCPATYADPTHDPRLR
jgi:hypothetical protein